MRKSHDGHPSNGSADDEIDGLDAYAPGGAPRPAATSEPVAGEDAADEQQPGSSAQGAAEQELAEQRDKYLRLAAEFDNFRKRTNRERVEAGSRGQAELLGKVLDVLDDLDRFGTVDPAETDATTVLDGVRMVNRKLAKELTAAGLERLNPVGEAFDPSLHEAMAAEPAASARDDGVVAKVYQSGYVFKGALLRPARVVVWQWNG